MADLGFRGLDNDILDPVIVTGRAPVEHGFAHLKNWRILTKLRTDPARATRLLRALFVLTNLEINRWQMIFSADSRPRPARVPRGPVARAL